MRKKHPKLIDESLTILVLFFGIFFQVGSAVAAAEPKITQLLSNPKKLVGIIDNQRGSERANSIRTLHDIVDGTNAKRGEAIQVICQIKPWSTGDIELNDTIQKLLWSIAVKESRNWTRLIAYSDCAAANRKFFYFDRAAKVSNIVEQVVCKGGAVGFLNEDRFRKLKSSINYVDETIDQYLQDKKFKSFYPLRNALRLALLYAHRGVSIYSMSPEKGRQFFAEASNILEKNNKVDILRASRNGWRFRSDFSILAAIYGVLSGNRQFEDVLRNYMSKWPFAKSDSHLGSAIEPNILEEMPDDYLDPVYIERLLPGAAENVSDECSRWRWTTYGPRRFAGQAVECFEKYRVIPLSWADLKKFDRCMARLIAIDWYVQFSSAAIDPEAQTRMEEERKKIVFKLKDRGEVANKVIDSLKVVKVKQMLALRTESEFNTKEIAKFRLDIGNSIKGILYGRSKYY